MKINCLHCGHAFGVDDSYCDYEGLLKCPTCAGLLEARIQDGMIRSVRPGSFAPPPPSPSPAPVTEVQAQTPASVQAQVQAATAEVREVQRIAQQAVQASEPVAQPVPQPVGADGASPSEAPDGPASA
jgi:hypothetical protein